ncbi:MAG: hypothetical protein ACKOWD_17960 [Rhodoferax sp.]
MSNLSSSAPLPGSTSLVAPSRWLRLSFMGDGASSLAIGLLHIALAEGVARTLAIPPAVLLETGWFLVLFGVVLLVAARRGHLHRAFVGFIVIGNIGWALACFALMATHALGQNTLGTAYLWVNVADVLFWAAMEWRGLQLSSRVRA